MDTQNNMQDFISNTLLMLQYMCIDSSMSTENQIVRSILLNNNNMECFGAVGKEMFRAQLVGLSLPW